MSGLTLNVSPSEPRGIWRRTHGPLKRGSYVLLAAPLKQIAAAPGDVVDGHRLESWQYWLKGDRPDAWDSRYFGIIPESLIISTAEPVWTEKK